MPSAGSVAADLGSSSVHLAVVIAIVAVGVAALVLLVRVLTVRRQRDLAARRPVPERTDVPARPLTAAPRSPVAPPRAQAVPPTRFFDAPLPDPASAPARRRPPAAHHPAGRRAPGTGQQRAVPPQPRRPLQAVAADLRRLTRELTMVPGGTPAARRLGLLAAYDDVLVEAAGLLQVPHRLTAQPEPLRELERIRLLGELEAAGLVVTG